MNSRDVKYGQWLGTLMYCLQAFAKYVSCERQHEVWELKKTTRVKYEVSISNHTEIRLLSGPPCRLINVIKR